MMTILHIGRQKTSDSITKFGCNTNIKSMQDDDVLFVPGGSLTIWWKSKIEVKKSSFDPSTFVVTSGEKATSIFCISRQIL